MTSFFFSFEQKAEILSMTSSLECFNLQKDLMKIEHSKNRLVEHSKKIDSLNIRKKESLNIRKTFQCSDFHNIFELTTRT